MGNTLGLLLEKISRYGIINNIIPGAVYCYLLNNYLKQHILGSSIIINLCLFYVVGLFISRIGSLIVEPICNKLHIINRAPYNDYIEVAQKDKKIVSLNDISSFYRTMIALILVSSITALVLKLDLSNTMRIVGTCVLIVFLLILMLLSFRKQVDYIRKRVEHNKKSI